MPSNFGEYLTRAQECLSCADQPISAEAKKEWLKLASFWIRLHEAQVRERSSEPGDTVA